MPEPRRTLSLKTKPRHQIEAERLLSLVDKHKARKREAESA